MTTIVVPYTRLTDGVTAALDATGRTYRTVLMGDEEGYWRLLADLWAAGDDFAVVEHDITVHPTVFEELDACDERWCVFPHDYVCGTYWGLGCARFRSELLAEHPDIMERVGERADTVHPPKHWCTIDKWLQDVLPAAGVHMHHHSTVLGHAGRQPTHGCI